MESSSTQGAPPRPEAVRPEYRRAAVDHPEGTNPKTKGWTRNKLAARVDRKLINGMYVNLGVGVPWNIHTQITASTA